MDVISQLKALPFTLETAQDDYGYYAKVREFPDEYEQEADREATMRAPARGLKGWSAVLSGNVDEWRKGHEEQLPYLLKVLVSSEDELTECLRNSECVNI